MKSGDIVQFERNMVLLGIIEEEVISTWDFEAEGMVDKPTLIVRFLPNLYGGYRTLSNCIKTDKLWVVG